MNGWPLKFNFSESRYLGAQIMKELLLFCIWNNADGVLAIESQSI